MKYATLDIGTNTIRLLIAQKKEGCSFDFICQKSKIARVGEGFGSNNIIKNEALNRALDILNEYKSIIKKYDVKEVFTTATSAIREAQNRQWFVENIKKAGFDLEVITPQQEAELTHMGIVYMLKDMIKNGNWLAFDLGGGSTEFMFSSKNKLISSFSIPLGGVKLFEMFVKNDPPKRSELASASEYFKKQLEKLIKKPYKPDFIVGNAGTVTSLAAIDMSLTIYSFEKTEGYKLKKENIDKILTKLVSLSAKQRLEKYKILEKGREDVIVVGAEIVKTILNFFDKDYIITTNGSLREGLLIKKVCYG